MSAGIQSVAIGCFFGQTLHAVDHFVITDVSSKIELTIVFIKAHVALTLRDGFLVFLAANLRQIGQKLCLIRFLVVAVHLPSLVVEFGAKDVIHLPVTGGGDGVVGIVG